MNPRPPSVTRSVTHIPDTTLRRAKDDRARLHNGPLRSSICERTQSGVEDDDADAVHGSEAISSFRDPAKHSPEPARPKVGSGELINPADVTNAGFCLPGRVRSLGSVQDQRPEDPS